MKWFRFYHEALHDPKVQQLRPELFKFWVNCLCLASERAERGTLPPVDEIAFIMRVKRTVVERFTNELVVEELLHRRPLETSLTGHCDVSVGFVIHQWSVRQPPSDDIGSRVKKHRQKGYVKPAGADVTLHETPSSVTCNGPDSELELELIPPYSPPGGDANGEAIRLGGTAEAEPPPKAKRAPRAKGPPACPPADGPLKVLDGPHPMDRAEVEAIWGEMLDAFGLKAVADGFYAHHRRFLPSTWRQAIQETLQRGVTLRSVMYVERIAESILARASQPSGGYRPPPRTRDVPLPPLYQRPEGFKPKKSRLPEEFRTPTNPKGFGQ